MSTTKQTIAPAPVVVQPGAVNQGYVGAPGYNEQPVTMNPAMQNVAYGASGAPGAYGPPMGGPPGAYGPPMGGPPGAYGPPMGGPPGAYGPPMGAPVAHGAPKGRGRGKPPVVWMPVPQSVPNCPPGLEYLTLIDQMLVQEQVDLLEMFTGFETNNKYAIRNSLGQQIYFAAEDNDCCTRNYCGAARPFEMKIMDNSGREVIHISRPYRCASCWCCCPCCMQEISVFAPPGKLIGKVRQEYTCCEPHYTIRDASDEKLLSIRGPCVQCRGCSDVEFKVLSRDEAIKVGDIRKQWTGLAQELFTDADNFGVSFPIDMSVTAKATILAAVFLIDFMFFTHNPNDDGFIY